jgi:GT2 family glycosyltransferase
MVFHGEPGVVENAGVLVLSNGDAVPRGRHEPAARYAAGGDLLAACGGAVLLRVAMLRAIGTFRDEFFANFEDLDLSLRAAATGWRTRYVPGAVVRHHLNVTIRKVRDRAFDVRSVRNATWAWLVNMPLPVILLNLPWFVLCNLGIVLCMPLLGRPAVARAFVQGRWQAFCERKQLRAARAALRPLRRGSWLSLWWRQRSWLFEYLRLLAQRLRGRRTTVLGR